MYYIIIGLSLIIVGLLVIVVYTNRKDFQSLTTTAKHRHPRNLRRVRGEKDIKKWFDDSDVKHFEDMKELSS